MSKNGLFLTGCYQCARYSHAHGRCLDGKINPKTYKGMKDAVNYFGINYICKHTVNGNKFRNRLVEETCKNLALSAAEAK